MWIELAQASVSLGAAAACAGLVWRIERQIDALEQALADAAARGREQEQRLATLANWRDGQELALHATDTGVSIVKAAHMGIADIPFSILEAIPPTAAPTRAVRQVHDAISEGIYTALSGLNKAVGRELRKGIGSGGKTAEPGSGTPPGATDEPRD